MFNNVVTASRMGCIETCPRQHFWCYEIGLRKEAVSHALRFGSAWARATEARWNGADYDTALEAAIPDDFDLDAFSCETLAALLLAYYTVYGPSEREGKMEPEVMLPFYRIGQTDFTAGGKMDALGVLHKRGEALIESKTTRARLDDGSDYWLRLAFNNQILQYLFEARLMGHDPQVAYYDVTRKPQIRPRAEIAEVSEDGLPVVRDASGARVYRRVGNKHAGYREVPRVSEDKEKGYFISKHPETPEEFGERLFKDALSRPEFYFRRKEIPILDRQLKQFERKRLGICKLIEYYREQELRDGECSGCGTVHEGYGCPSEYASQSRDEEAWPKFVREQNCMHCSYKSFCLNDEEIDLSHPPKGYSIQPFNPELEDKTEEDSKDEAQ